MLPLFQEYQIAHHRFREHLRISLIMALIAPACAVTFYFQLNWLNPWLWGCCGVGLSLASCLTCVFMLHRIRNREKLSRFSRHLVATSAEWFPYFFILIQGLIISLIVMFIWFSLTVLALQVPLYVNVILVALALLFPVRRLVWLHIAMTKPDTLGRTDELLHGIWHVMITVFLARVVIALTMTAKEQDGTEGGVGLQVLIWVPAAVYIIYTAIMTLYHLMHGKHTELTRVAAPRSKQEDEPVDRF